MTPCIVWVCRQMHVCRRILSGVVLYDCAHTCVFQKSGIRGRSVHGLRMFLSSRAPVHVRQKQAIVRCHGSCDGDCPGMCFGLEGVRCHGIFRSTCVRVLHARVPSRGARSLSRLLVRCMCVCAHARTHKCVLKKNNEFVVIPRLAATFRLSFRIYQRVAQISVPLGVVGGAYMCDDVISRAHAVTMYFAGVSADTFVLQNSIWVIQYGCAHTHMCVTEGRSS